MDQSFPNPFAVGAADDLSRGKPRDSLLLTAQLMLPGLAKPASVRVRNLSEGGLMAEYTGAAGNGDAVAVELRGIGTVSGTIAWVAEGRVGIAFDTPIDPKLARKPVAAPPRLAPRPALKPV